MPYWHTAQVDTCTVCACLQSHQERIYQEYMAGKLKDKLTQVEGYYEQLLSHNQAELSCERISLFQISFFITISL